ncbi:sporulation integral membrane protein YtvI [Niallia nealsonii]|uniref:Sporulation integral membrane protein YtvI n=1 Tax=Niallia nealsonii TaxID=115979 RepID=A0A2N0Z665_9BACI|nr:sporulation integral membrane protein YtvI [Niallia nealsonii]PKG24999.1 sporulation integral membrane protein YtvI [Niallia nealsonii]
MNQTYLDRTFRLLFVILLAVVTIVSIFYLSKITYPFIIGFLIAFIMNPLVNFFQYTCKLPRTFAVVLSILLILSVFAGLITLLIAEIVAGAAYLADVVPKHIDTLIEYIENIFTAQIIPFYNKIASLFNNLETGQQDTIIANIKNVGEQVGTKMGDFIQGFFQKIPIILSWFPNAASVLIFSLLATFFISKDWTRLATKFGKILPSRVHRSSKTVFFDLKKALLGFIKAQLTLVSITTVIILIGLLILRVDYAITIALITGIVDIIPYLGTGLIFIPWIIYEMITGQTGIAIGLSVLYIIVLVQRQIMEPKILSTSIGLDPLATLIALFVGFKLMGFLGLLIGPVTLVIISTLNRANIFHDVWNYIVGKNN